MVVHGMPKLVLAQLKMVILRYFNGQEVTAATGANIPARRLLQMDSQILYDGVMKTAVQSRKILKIKSSRNLILI
jgi:hypothetical protein